MPTGTSGLYKGTRGAKEALKTKYAAEAKTLARRWSVSLARAYETIMKRIDKGLPPLPETVAHSAAKPAATAKPSRKPTGKKPAKKKPVAKKKPELLGVTPDEAKEIIADLKKKGFPVPNAIVRFPTDPKDNEITPFNPAAFDEFNEKEAHQNPEQKTAPAPDSLIASVAAGHYDLPHSVNETIELIEFIMARRNIPRMAAFCISQGLRYIMRDGVKTDDWCKDIAKAENYLHRALTGKWNDNAEAAKKDCAK